MNRFQQIKTLLDSLEEDFGKFYDKGNKAAGTRIRKGMQEMKNLSLEVRKEVQSIKNEAEEEAPKKEAPKKEAPKKEAPKKDKKK